MIWFATNSYVPFSDLRNPMSDRSLFTCFGGAPLLVDEKIWPKTDLRQDANDFLHKTEELMFNAFISCLIQPPLLITTALRKQ